MASVKIIDERHADGDVRSALVAYGEAFGAEALDAESPLVATAALLLCTLAVAFLPSAAHSITSAKGRRCGQRRPYCASSGNTCRPPAPQAT